MPRAWPFRRASNWNVGAEASPAIGAFFSLPGLACRHCWCDASIVGKREFLRRHSDLLLERVRPPPDRRWPRRSPAGACLAGATRQNHRLPGVQCRPQGGRPARRNGIPSMSNAAVSAPPGTATISCNALPPRAWRLHPRTVRLLLLYRAMLRARLGDCPPPRGQAAIAGENAAAGARLPAGGRPGHGNAG